MFASVTPAGVLYVVATPLGNLGDITFRAIETLKSVDLIACEDTRTSQPLLNHFGIHKPLISYHNFNERNIADKLINRILSGESIALISDAGTPSISDPGFIIVRSAAEKGIPVVPIPGASALIAALAVSGLPTDAFIFYGFLPPTAGKKLAILQGLADRRETMIFYESPFKLQKTLDMMSKIFANRQIVICRELTKKFEEIIRGNLVEVADSLRSRTLKGEITLVLEGLTRKQKQSSRSDS